MIEVSAMIGGNAKVEATTDWGSPRRGIIDKVKGKETDRLKRIGLVTKEIEMNRQA